MNELEKLGLTQNTIVIFSSDNGPTYDDGYDDGTKVKTSMEEVDRGHDGSGIYRGGKYQIFEGGTRVPFIIRWPARIQPGVSDALVNQIDFIASFAELLDIELPATEARDSRNMLPAFLGKDPIGLDVMIEEAAGLALRQGPWKYMQKQKVSRLGVKPAALFNLEDDPGEMNNLIKRYPEKAQAMERQLLEMKTSGGIRE